MTSLPLLILRVAAVSTVFVVSGCATLSSPSPKADPFESFNRASFKVNETLDDVVLKPVAKGYVAVTPGFVRAGIGNAFENVGDVNTAFNNLLQGKVGNAFSDLGRVLVNTTLGVIGLWDVATPMGLEKHKEDFGQTLGKWGVASGPYLVLPLMGPSTLRDTFGRPVDSALGYYRNIDHRRTANSLLLTEIITMRASMLGADHTFETAALDKYNFVRDAYLQRRLAKIYDGKPPQEKRDALDDSLDPPPANK